MNERNAVRVSNDISLNCKSFFFFPLTFWCFHQLGSSQRYPDLSLASLGVGSGNCPCSYADSSPNHHKSSIQ